eukprot:gene25594-11247_t
MLGEDSPVVQIVDYPISDDQQHNGGSNKHKHKKDKHKKDKHKHKRRHSSRERESSLDGDNVKVPSRPRREDISRDMSKRGSEGTPESGEILDGPASPSTASALPKDSTKDTTNGDGGSERMSEPPSASKSRTREDEPYKEQPSKRHRAEDPHGRQSDRKSEGAASKGGRHSDREPEGAASKEGRRSSKDPGRRLRDEPREPKGSERDRDREQTRTGSRLGPGLGQGADREQERERDRRDRDRGARGEVELRGERAGEREEKRGREGREGRDGREGRGRDGEREREREREERRDRGGSRGRSAVGGAGQAVQGQRARGEQGSYRDPREVDRPRSEREREREQDGGRDADRYGRGRGGDQIGQLGHSVRHDSRDSYRRGGRSKSRERGRGHRDSVKGDSSPEVDPEVAEKLLRFEQSGDEVDEEQRLIEERRKRLQAIKEKHAQQAALTERRKRLQAIKEKHSQQAALTAAALAQKKIEGAEGTPGRGSEPPSTPPIPTDGDRTPEGDRESSSSSGGVADGPVLEIWGTEVVADDADSAVPRSGAGGFLQPGTHTQEGQMAAMAATAAAAAAGGGLGPGGRPPGLPKPPQHVAAAAVPLTVAAAAAVAEAGGGDEEVDDMFAEEVKDELFGGTAPGGDTEAGAGPAPAAALADAYDDNEGYYNFQVGEMMDGRNELFASSGKVGEMMDGRYELFASSGKGVFSSVVRARDMHRKDERSQHPEVAIKLIRSNDIMFKAAQMEQSILKQLCASDPDNKKHCIKMLRCFDTLALSTAIHICLPFEAMFRFLPHCLAVSVTGLPLPTASTAALL